METQSLFKKAISSYFPLFKFRKLQFDMWRHRLDNTSTRFRAYDRFLYPGLQFTSNTLTYVYHLTPDSLSIFWLFYSIIYCFYPSV